MGNDCGAIIDGLKCAPGEGLTYGSTRIYWSRRGIDGHGGVG